MPREVDKMTVAARNVLSAIWKKSLLRGRCWGLRSGLFKGNPFAGSNIVVADQNELVAICASDEGELVIHEFTRIRGEGEGIGTALGRKIKEILSEEELPFRK